MSSNPHLAPTPELVWIPKTESTWQQGADAFHAFHAGRALINNPYPFRYDGSAASKDHHAWVNGYEWARSQQWLKDHKSA